MLRNRLFKQPVKDHMYYNRFLCSKVAEISDKIDAIRSKSALTEAQAHHFHAQLNYLADKGKQLGIPLDDYINETRQAILVESNIVCEKLVEQARGKKRRFSV